MGFVVPFRSYVREIYEIEWNSEFAGDHFPRMGFSRSRRSVQQESSRYLRAVFFENFRIPYLGYEIPNFRFQIVRSGDVGKLESRFFRNDVLVHYLFLPERLDGMEQSERRSLAVDDGFHFFRKEASDCVIAQHSANDLPYLGSREPLGFLGQRIQIDSVVQKGVPGILCRLFQVYFPNFLSGFEIGIAYENLVIEPSGSQDCGI